MTTHYEMDRDGRRLRTSAHQTSEPDEAEIDALAEHFFSQDSLYPISFDASDESNQQQARGAMYATLTLLGVASTLIGGFLIYSKLIMPVPIELGQTDWLDALPLPAATATASPLREPRPIAALTATLAGADEASSPTTPAAEGGETPSKPVEALEQKVAASEAAPPSAARPIPSDNTRSEAEPTPSPQPYQPTASPPVEHARQTVAAIEQPGAVDDQAAPRAQPTAAQRREDLVRRAYGSLYRGDAPNALQFARQAVSEAPQRADAWIALGSAYDALHDRSSARAAFRNCVAQAHGPFLSQCRALTND